MICTMSRDPTLVFCPPNPLLITTLFTAENSHKIYFFISQHIYITVLLPTTDFQKLYQLIPELYFQNVIIKSMISHCSLGPHTWTKKKKTCELTDENCKIKILEKSVSPFPVPHHQNHFRVYSGLATGAAVGGNKR